MPRNTENGREPHEHEAGSELPSSDELGRRGFLSGTAGLMAAAAYSANVPETASARISNRDDGETQTVSSPDGTVEVTVDVCGGVPTYAVAYDGTTYRIGYGVCGHRL